MRSRHGLGLGITLVIVALLAVTGAMLASLTISRLQIMATLDQQREAHLRAMSAVNLVIGRWRSQPSDRQAVDGEARLTFDSGQAGRWGLPLSVNNLQGLTAAGGVPAASARLVVEGRSGGARERLEVMVTQPVYPFALATTGSIQSQQGLIVAGLDSDDPDSLRRLVENPVKFGKPANVLANAAIQLLGPSTICGDLQSGGTVNLQGNPIQVLGEVREGQAASAVPEIALPSLLAGVAPQVVRGAPSGQPTLEGTVLCEGPFECPGDLTLNGATLYVRGDLRVGGGVKGVGSLVVEGATMLQGSADLAASGRLALIGGGDVTLSGSGSGRSYFRGLVYTRGRLTARGLTIFGCLLGGPPGPAGPQLDLQDCVVLQDTSPIAVRSGPAAETLKLSGQGFQGFTFTVTSQVVGPGQLSFQVFQGPTLKFEQRVQIDRSADRQVLRSNFSRLLNRPAGTAQFSGVGPALDVRLEEGLLAGDLRQLERRLVRYAGVPIFDLNQFLQVRDRLRIASCRRL